MVQVILGSAYIVDCTIVIVNNSSNNIIKTIICPNKKAAKIELKRMKVRPVRPYYPKRIKK